MVESGLNDGIQVPATLDLYGKPISTADQAFAQMYTQLCRFSTKLIPDAMDVVATAILEYSSPPPVYPSTEEDFLSPIRFVQVVLATMIKGFWEQKRHYRTKHMGLLTWVPTSRKMVTDTIPEAQMLLEAICIIDKVNIGSHDREFIEAIIQNLQQSDSAGIISDGEMARINGLATRVAGMGARNIKLTANTFLTQLRDCFVVPPVNPNHQLPQHAAMVAIADTVKPKFNQTRLPASKSGGAGPAPERKPTSQDHSNAGLERRVNDLHSMMGQVLKRLDQLQGSPRDENSQPNRRKGGSQGSKIQGQAEPTKHFAGKAKTGRASKKSFVRENTSDEEDSEENMDPVIHRAYQARAQVNFVEHDDAYSGPSSKFIIKPYGRSQSGSVLKEELGRMRADILTTQRVIATALDRDDDGMPELISSDDELPTSMGNGGVPPFTNLETYNLERNLCENPLLEPLGREAANLRYASRPRLQVLRTSWSLLSHAEQETLLTYVTGIDFQEDIDEMYPELKLVSKIEPDNLKLDYDLLSAIERGVDEADMNRHVKLLRLLWNSRKKGSQTENEEYLRQVILDNGKSRHRFPWIANDIGLADLKDPKFLPMATDDHTSNWFDKEHFETLRFEMRHNFQPSTLDRIWISQHTQWLLLAKQDPAVFSDPEQCLQAHSEAITKYIAARKLHHEAKAAIGQSDIWTWLSVANSYLEQNPVDLALLPCATMPNGERKEHYLEQQHRAELARLHAKRAESFVEQYIEIDDGLVEPLDSTSSTTPTTTSDCRRKTRRQTWLESLVIPPVTMPSSSDEDELIAPRPGRRAKKSRATGRA